MTTPHLYYEQKCPHLRVSQHSVMNLATHAGEGEAVERWCAEGLRIPLGSLEEVRGRIQHALVDENGLAALHDPAGLAAAIVQSIVRRALEEEE